MPAPLRDREAALARLKAEGRATAEPLLSDDDWERLLDAQQIAEPWTPETPVVPGQAIAPTTPNGFLYEVVLGRDQDGLPGGVTGAVEPRWPLDPRWPSWEPATVDDGTARFRLKGRETRGLWDLRAALHAAWTERAALVAGDYATSLEGNGMHPETVIDQCLRMAARYAPVRIL